jgi:hypothetical protein
MEGMRTLGNDRMQPIIAFPLPRTLKQLRVFLELTGYYSIWILGYQTWLYPYTMLSRRLKSTPSLLLNGIVLPLMLFIN